MKILFRICSDFISGSVGGVSAARLEEVGEEGGEGGRGCPAEDIARWRGVRA